MPEPEDLPPLPPLTLRQLHELISPLLEQFGDYDLVTEGCDCTGDVVAIDLRDGRAYLRRHGFGVDSLRDPVDRSVMLPDPEETPHV